MRGLFKDYVGVEQKSLKNEIFDGLYLNSKGNGEVHLYSPLWSYLLIPISKLLLLKHEYSSVF